jgi:hypothetical protein
VSARASTATTARAAHRRHRLAIRIALTLVNNGGQQRGHTSLRLLVVSSILDCSTISEVLDRCDQLPLGPHANRVLVHRLVENRERYKRRQFEILQADADLGGALSYEADVRRGGENLVDAARALFDIVDGVLKRQPSNRRQLVSRELKREGQVSLEMKRMQTMSHPELIELRQLAQLDRQPLELVVEDLKRG